MKVSQDTHNLWFTLRPAGVEPTFSKRILLYFLFAWIDCNLARTLYNFFDATRFSTLIRVGLIATDSSDSRYQLSQSFSTLIRVGLIATASTLVVDEYHLAFQYPHPGWIDCNISVSHTKSRDHLCFSTLIRVGLIATHPRNRTSQDTHNLWFTLRPAGVEPTFSYSIVKEH
jgi:hypothetical protein